MLNPALFGCKSYNEMIDALNNGKELSADSLHFSIKPDTSGGFQTISTGDISFDRTIPELKRVMNWLCLEKNSGGMPYNGFYITNLDGNPVAPDQADAVDYDQASEILKNLNTEAYVVPIFRGERAELKASISAPVEDGEKNESKRPERKGSEPGYF